ncbi:hypothetical protein H1P_3200003 [Hyella patelloides LEGE 07179]|uniref:Uncharacterized protein n=1 Tax=Hyella patelloides LEGE 07179 TaxID=945734 RepID=A0A563VV50_9CYAN|nr:hypothetical protein H1P_3200003 [Hyella patelloides LEGE 07179]
MASKNSSFQCGRGLEEIMQQINCKVGNAHSTLILFLCVANIF